MKPDEPELSEHLRRRVAALHDAPPGSAQPLGPDARQRVLSRLQTDAARLQRQRRMLRTAGIGMGVVALAAVALLALRQAAAPSLQPTAAKTQPPPTAASAPACALPIIAGARAFADLPDGRRALSLGATFGHLMADAAADVQIERSAPCELTLRLAHGELAGDLQSLRPARLVVRADQGDVVITGTRFSVRSGDDLEVVLASGVVDVLFSDRSSLRLQPGTRLHRASPQQRPDTLQLSAAHEQHLRELLSTEPRPAPVHVIEEPAAPAVRSASGSTTSWLEVAEAARRAGRYADARTAYRTASQRRDASAEVALLRWVRLELDAADPAAALGVLQLHTRRFARGRLGAEAGWLEVQVRQALQQPERAVQAARELVERHPNTPQAAAAARLIPAR